MYTIFNDDIKNKFFLSSLSTSVTDGSPEKNPQEKNNKLTDETQVAKTSLQNRKPFSLNKLKTVISQEPPLPKELAKA